MYSRFDKTVLFVFHYKVFGNCVIEYFQSINTQNANEEADKNYRCCGRRFK